MFIALLDLPTESIPQPAFLFPFDQTHTAHQNAAMTSCFICGRALSGPVSQYYRCISCGHEVLDDQSRTGTVVNDALDIAQLSKPDGLVKAQVKLAIAAIAPNPSTQSRLLDIGCGSGRFLHHARNHFSAVSGVEVDEQSKAFARSAFHLDIEDDITKAPVDKADLITFWHSLEHIPAPAMDSIFSKIATARNARLLISVPNAASWQYRWLGTAYPYYDIPAHLHQFTPQSLDGFLNKHGFKRTASFAVTSYIVFGWVQGLLNLVFPIRNYVYYRLKRGWDFGLPPYKKVGYDILSALLLPAAVGIGAALTLAELFCRDKQAVITARYEHI